MFRTAVLRCSDINIPAHLSYFCQSVTTDAFVSMRLQDQTFFCGFTRLSHLSVAALGSVYSCDARVRGVFVFAVGSDARMPAHSLNWQFESAIRNKNRKQKQEWSSEERKKNSVIFKWAEDESSEKVLESAKPRFSSNDR